MALAPQIEEPDPLDPVHVTGGRVDRARLVDVWATGVEIADYQSVPAALRLEGSD
jgi:hypothetical protein